MTLIGMAGLEPVGRAIGRRLQATSSFRVLGYDPDLESSATSGLRTTGSIDRFLEASEVIVVGRGGGSGVELVHQLVSQGRRKDVIVCSRISPADARELLAVVTTAGGE